MAMVNRTHPPESTMVYDPTRHEPLQDVRWDAGDAWALLHDIVRDTQAAFSDETYWPCHPLDRDDDEAPGGVDTPLYHGACGVLWALRYLHTVGASEISLDLSDRLDVLGVRNQRWLGDAADRERASYLMGETPVQMMKLDCAPSPDTADVLEGLVRGNIDHPARELMWGAPGTLLACLLLYEKSADPRWEALFRQTAAHLWCQLEISEHLGCACWTQDLYGRRSTYLGAVHGFAATALPLIRGRHLLPPEDWAAWERCIINTMTRTAQRSGDLVNWPPQLMAPDVPQKRLMQFCHGAPGMIVCLADIPSPALDDLLLAAGETLWVAGPLTKGSNLCHGTGGNGYAFLKLFQRTGDACWLDRARSFAAHGILQTREATRRYGQGRYSLWTGDPGFAIYLWDCLRAEPRFPTLEVFFPQRPTRPTAPPPS